MDERASILAFSNAAGVGPKGLQGLLRVYGSAKAAWEKPIEEKYKDAGVGHANFLKFFDSRNSFNHLVYLDQLKKAKVEFIPYGDKFYPAGLAKIDNPPIGIYIKGNKELLLSAKNIGVVGARKVTSYGRQVTESLVANLCSYGFVIVSGLAAGVDGIAHKTAVDSQGKTIAVLGCGVDCAYPKENEKLYEEILDREGLIISEYPLGMAANIGTFPARNRIVAALSLAVLITEAAEDSGSLITADLASKQGKTVFAVPGPITSQMSRGAIKLLKQGAVMVSSGQDIIDELGIKNNELGKNSAKQKNLKLNKDEQKILDCIQNEDKTIDEIARETKIKTSKLMTILSGMELAGIIKNSSGKFSYDA